jgi:hypothetical protein
MKAFAVLSLLVLTVLAQEPIRPAIESDLVVLKFNWSKYRQASGLIHGVDDPPDAMNAPVTIPRPTTRNEPQEVKNRRDMNERRIEMAITEKNAASSAVKGADFYLLHLQLKNAGSKTVKSFIWEFQPSALITDYEPRQYVCTVKAKPNDTKTFDIVTPFSPVKVVTASEKKSADKEGRVLVNRIEYSDGSIWKRQGWSILIPPDLTEKLPLGKCIVF